jgi:hypothetical protein
MEYVVVIADLKGSRTMGVEERRGAQRVLRRMVGHLNTEYRPSLAARFAITTGDELQGLLKTTKRLPSLLWDLVARTSPLRLQVGIGHGSLTLPLRPVAIDVDGPAFHRAREAIEQARTTLGWEVFRGFGTSETDDILTGLAAAMFAVRDRMSERQWQVAAAIHDGMTGTEAAKRLGITPQAVSLYRRHGYYEAYQEAEHALATLLGRIEQGQRS